MSDTSDITDATGTAGAATDVDAFIGLGANLGDAAATLQAALQALAALPQTRLHAASSLYGSAPLHAEGPPLRQRRGMAAHDIGATPPADRTAAD